jgi:phage recombination protein Bet
MSGEKAITLPAPSQGPRAAASRLAPLGANGVGMTRDQVELLKRTVARGVTDDELSLFVHVANRAGLDPFAKQVYAIRRRQKVDGQYRDVMTIQTGIDGFRLVASRTGAHAGTDEAVFETDAEGRPTKATVTVWKMVGGARVSFTAAARWEEYVQTYKDNDTGRHEPSGLWKKMPFTMLAKCAEGLALRKAFPMDLSGIYAHEEMTQADAPGTPTPIDAAPQEPPRRVIEASVAPAPALPSATNGAPAAPAAAAEKSPALLLREAWEDLLLLVRNARIYTDAPSPEDAAVLYAKEKGVDIEAFRAAKKAGTATAADAKSIAERLRAIANVKPPPPAAATAPPSPAFDDDLPF